MLVEDAFLHTRWARRWVLSRQPRDQMAGLIALPVIWVGSLALLVATILLLRRGTSP